MNDNRIKKQNGPLGPCISLHDARCAWFTFNNAAHAVMQCDIDIFRDFIKIITPSGKFDIAVRATLKQRELSDVERWFCLTETIALYAASERGAIPLFPCKDDAEQSLKKEAATA